MKSIETDVLVVGSGAAGLMAAVRAAQMGCRVVLASKSSHRGGNSALAGGAWLVPSDDLPPRDYFTLVMEAGKQINDAKLVRILAERGGPMVRALGDMGMPLERMGKRYWVVKTGIDDKIPGIVLMNKLLENIKDERIRPLPWFSIVELLMDEGRVSGAIGISRDEGQAVVRAKSVVLATGGGGGIYKRHDNHRRIIGDGYWLALGIGLPLRDMEFVQYYPLALAEPNLPPIILYDFPEEVVAINSQGEDLLKKHGLEFDLNASLDEYRDQFTFTLIREKEKGNVYLDFTRVPREKWKIHPLNRLETRNPDFRNRPVSVAPVVHFFMGGVEIKEDAQTDVPGLFAAGEVTAGVHGANRVGGNALTECVVFGGIAGESAARYALGTSQGKTRGDRVRDKLPRNDQTAEAREIFREVQELTSAHAGPIRKATSLEEGLAKISRVEQRLTALEREGWSVQLNEVKGSLVVAKAIMTASLAREESRGAFCREDFPREDDETWLKNIRLNLDRETNEFTVSYRAVEGFR